MKKQMSRVSCENRIRGVCGSKCAICFKRSFATSPKSQFWDMKKNSYETYQIPRSSLKKYWFSCDVCPHSFSMSLANVNAGSWCHFCASKKICGEPECRMCREKSFEDSMNSDKWHREKNPEQPIQVFKWSNKRYWFVCGECNHEFQMACANVQQGHWCPYCSGNSLCSDECAMCFDRSFASSNRAIGWHHKNKTSPRMVHVKSSKKVWFLCDAGHTFSAMPLNVTNGNTWCPRCKNKGENEVMLFLSSKYFDVSHHVSFPWSVSHKGGRYVYDFCIPSKRKLIELDGRQHVEQVSNWESFEQIQERDTIKMEQAVLNDDWEIVRLSRVRKNPHWKTQLCDAIDTTGVVFQSITNEDKFNDFYSFLKTHLDLVTGIRTPSPSYTACRSPHSTKG